MANQYTIKRTAIDDALGISRRFRDGINGISAVSVFEEKTALDGKPVRMKGGQAPSGLVSERGAAGAMNMAFIAAIEGGKVGVTVAELLAVCHDNNTANNKAADQMDKLAAHIKSFVLQADRSRAAVNGIVQTARKNGWDYAAVAENAVLLDGKPWDGKLFKRSVTAQTVICPVVLYAVHFKRTNTLVKRLGLDKPE